MRVLTDAHGEGTVMETNGVRTLVAGRGLVESPRWHDDRLYFSDWSLAEIAR
jgi:sugar lactone lactonase YvrE